MLQKRLLQEQNPLLSQLVRIAELWQAADSAQTAFGTKATEYVRQAYTEEKREESTEYIRKASDYKTSINEKWKNDRQTNDRRSPNIDSCQGCGDHGDKMHNRDMCPATDRECYNCLSKDHFSRVCRKPPRNQTRYVQKMVRVTETHGGGGRSYPHDGERQSFSTRRRKTIYV